MTMASNNALIEKYRAQVPDWKISADEKSITREFKLKDFADVMKLLNAVADIANAENHHPNVYIFDFNKIRFELSTHDVGGLSEKDFSLAVKIDALKI
jgi:4a-hydroxytetrahydrobiopterin dehydratase